MATDGDIQKTISDLIARERDLRERLGKGEIDASTEHEELAATETRLDQCWDLLRQRQAAREFGGDPDQAKVRPAEVVERYRG
ncbi:DUF2630 family protein [Isoptericola sp. NPDC056618]|uniref:DUF2630 family protein n=1 Tax=unclassified Isoptericola TaxID=2623355 RepID=UPI00365D368D